MQISLIKGCFFYDEKEFYIDRLEYLRNIAHVYFTMKL